MMSIIQTIISGSALILGVMYLIGGLIVNLSLTRRGITEYQILKVKYLVVGLIFLLQSVGIFVLASIPAFFLLTLSGHRLIVQLLNLLSMSASIVLLRVWAKLPRDTTSILSQWRFWFVASTIGSLFSMMILMRQLLVPRFDIYAVLLSVQALMSGVLVFIAQIYHYSAFYYGRAKPKGALDPIGIGIPTAVRLACDKDAVDLLRGLGVPIDATGITEEVLLIDETDKQYIIGLKRAPKEPAAEERTLKISKEMIKAILYKPQHMRQIGGERTHSRR